MNTIPFLTLEKFNQAINTIDYGETAIICYLKGKKPRFVFKYEESSLETDGLSAEKNSEFAKKQSKGKKNE